MFFINIKNINILAFFLQVQKNPIPILVFYLWGLEWLTSQNSIKCLSFSFFFSTPLTHIEATLSSLQKQLSHTQRQLFLLCKGNSLWVYSVHKDYTFDFCQCNSIASTQLCSLLVGHWDHMGPTEFLFIISNAIYVHK